MARRYRKVETAIWGDERFRRLSAPQPCGQHLWFFLLTSGRTIAIPGVVLGREAELAGAIGWTVQGFRQAFGEALREGLVEADWEAGVILLRKALLDGSGRPRETAIPESPNVLRSWGKVWPEIPDSPLKYELLRRLGTFAEALGPPFAKAFAEAFPEASRHPSPNQDQDQDQDQDLRSTDRPTSTTPGGDLLEAPRAREARKPKGSPKRGKTTLPESWQPSPTEIALARDLGVNLEHEAATFRDYAAANGREQVDWSASFRTWLRRARSYGHGSNGARMAPQQRGVMDVLAEQMEEIRRGERG